MYSFECWHTKGTCHYATSRRPEGEWQAWWAGEGWRSPFQHLGLRTDSSLLFLSALYYRVQSYSLWSFDFVQRSASRNEQQYFLASCFPQHRLLATSPGFCQKAKFQTGAAPLISIIIDYNYLTSPYTLRGTWRKIRFAKCSFYLCKIVQACFRVLLA